MTVKVQSEHTIHGVSIRKIHFGVDEGECRAAYGDSGDVYYSDKYGDHIVKLVWDDNRETYAHGIEVTSMDDFMERPSLQYLFDEGFLPGDVTRYSFDIVGHEIKEEEWR